MFSVVFSQQKWGYFSGRTTQIWCSTEGAKFVGVTTSPVLSPSATVWFTQAVKHSETQSSDV